MPIGDTSALLARAEVDFGVARIYSEGPSARLLTVDHVGQSYIDIVDPRQLRFDYCRWVRVVLDAISPPRQAIRALHIGGAGLTLPRYIATTRPGSTQVVIEADARLSQFVATHLPLPESCGIDLRVGDGGELIDTLGDNSFDVVINDAFEVARLPASLTGPAFAQQVNRVLDQHGQYVLNILDLDEMYISRVQTRVLYEVFADACIVAAHTEMGDRLFRNVLAVADDSPNGVPVSSLAQVAAEHDIPVALLRGPKLRAFAGLND